MLQRDVRIVRGALNGMARTNVASGEIEAVHTDVNQMRADMHEMEIRLDLLEKEGRR